MATSAPDRDVLQALEHALEEVRRLSVVLRAVLDANEAGVQLPHKMVDDYRAQLDRVEADRERMEQIVRVLWAMLESAPH